MKTTTVWKTLEIKCGGEKRKARLLTEWVEKNGSRELKGIICDNPRLSQEEPYDCSWSCWSALTGKTEPRATASKPARKKKAAPGKKAVPAKSRARRMA
jgi:hypothetical protein